jgi:hypothetical protein
MSVISEARDLEVISAAIAQKTAALKSDVDAINLFSGLVELAASLALAFA